MPAHAFGGMLTRMKNTILDHNAALPTSYLPTADQLVVAVDGRDLRVIRYATLDEPLYLVHASLPDDGTEHELEISIKRKHTRVALLSSTGLVPMTKGGARGRSLVTTFTGAPYFCLSCDGLGYVALCFDPEQALPVGAGVLSSDACGLVGDGSQVVTDTLQAAINKVSETDSLHTLVLEAGHYRSGDLELRSGVQLHLASGAVLQASDNADDLGDPSLSGFDAKRACFIHSLQANNISITGHGHIDGNRAVLDVQRYFKGMVQLVAGKGVTIDGPVFSDACGWNTIPRHCDDVRVHRLKIMCNRPRISCINTDGCNPDGCQGVTIDHCFFHTGDDAVAVKATDYGGEARDCTDVRVTDLLAVNNSATAKIGTETRASRMADISFERVCAVRTARLVACDAFDEAAIENISWKDCYVYEQDDLWTESYIVHLNAPPARTAFRSIPALATVRDVRLAHISSRDPGNALMIARLDGDVPAIQDITVHDLTAAGQPLPLVTEHTATAPANPEVQIG
jgi:hypothetical protein